jgi:hypothetical protein
VPRFFFAKVASLCVSVSVYFSICSPLLRLQLAMERVTNNKQIVAPDAAPTLANIL